MLAMQDQTLLWPRPRPCRAECACEPAINRTTDELRNHTAQILILPKKIVRLWGAHWNVCNLLLIGMWRCFDPYTTIAGHWKASPTGFRISAARQRSAKKRGSGRRTNVQKPVYKLIHESTPFSALPPASIILIIGIPSPPSFSPFIAPRFSNKELPSLRYRLRAVRREKGHLISEKTPRRSSTPYRPATSTLSPTDAHDPNLISSGVEEAQTRTS